MNYNHLEEKKLDSQNVFNGNLLHVFKDSIELPNKAKSTREYIKHLGAVCIVPLTDDGKIYIEHQYRYPLHQPIIEIPAGKLDSAQEDHLEAAKRELKEETGLEAKTWKDLGIYTPSPAYSDERIYTYLATDLSMGERHLDEDEFLDVEAIPLEEAVKMVMDGRIIDGKTQAAILKVAKLFDNGF